MSESQPLAPAARLHAIVRGRVQGVSFRYYTRERALELGLKGWVRNCADGSVETLAEGPRPALEAFHQFLQRGPSAAWVEAVEAVWSEAQGNLSRFDVRF